ncbi:hypothetical protein RJ639_008345 [Escallonia herrerae]|uniref:peptidylprolyl isomerase n=1 Tax=Escallonia herrerae TaxID=1293975 RepID=A0AA89ASC5_9ASTE|nr:hypothetical protein RJ639_008345 [Escallonia herrerae]
MFPTSRVPSRRVRIEETHDDEKPANGNSMSKRPKKKDTALSVSDDRENSRKQIMVSGSSVPALRVKTKMVSLFLPLEKPGEVKEQRLGKKKKVDDDLGHSKSGKRKIDSIIQDGDQARNGETGGLDSSVPLTEVVPQSDLKHTKKNKKKKVKATDEKAHDGGSDVKTLQTEEATTKDMDKLVAVRNESDQKPISERRLFFPAIHDKSDGMQRSPDFDADANCFRMIEKNNKKKSKKHETAVGADKKQTVEEKNFSTKEEEKAEAMPFQVSVHYIGKLKKNGKIFDSNIGRAPFEVRLGIRKVIKVWDVGVNGNYTLLDLSYYYLIYVQRINTDISVNAIIRHAYRGQKKTHNSTSNGLWSWRCSWGHTTKCMVGFDVELVNSSTCFPSSSPSRSPSSLSLFLSSVTTLLSSSTSFPMAGNAIFSPTEQREPVPFMLALLLFPTTTLDTLRVSFSSSVCEDDFELPTSNTTMIRLQRQKTRWELGAARVINSTVEMSMVVGEMEKEGLDELNRGNGR